MKTAVNVDATIASIEASIVTIVREAALPSTQERFVAQSGVGLERAAYGVLRHVAEGGPTRLTELARDLGLDSSTVSRHVSALERLGLLARVADVADRRVANLEVTAAGRKALERLRVARHRFFAELLSAWPAEDREQLAPLLDRLARDFLETGRR
jgi:DNA-binding MarR family transcriptional regulator